MINEAENKEIEEEDGDLEDEAEDELEQEEDEDINYDETRDSIFVSTIVLLLPSPKCLARIKCTSFRLMVVGIQH